MSAFDELLEKSNADDFRRYRRNLVSNRGNFFSGKLSKYMSLRTSRTENSSLFNNSDNDNKITKLFIRKESRSEDYGFIFNLDGTQLAIDTISKNAHLDIYNQFSDKLLFESLDQTQLWNSASDYTKKKLIADDINNMMKKTDIEYRTHGDRMHYFVLGKITTEELKNQSIERNSYPMFLFSCTETDKKRMYINVEQTGFINFSLDEKLLDNEIRNYLGSLEVTIDNNLANKLNAIKMKLENLTINNLQKIEVDPSYSMIGIISGFETEYVDQAWEKMVL